MKFGGEWYGEKGMCSSIECSELKLKEDGGAGGIEGAVPVGLAEAMIIDSIQRNYIPRVRKGDTS